MQQRRLELGRDDLSGLQPVSGLEHVRQGGAGATLADVLLCADLEVQGADPVRGRHRSDGQRG